MEGAEGADNSEQLEELTSLCRQLVEEQRELRHIIDKQGRTPWLEASGLGSVKFYQALDTTSADVVVTMDKKERTKSLEASRVGYIVRPQWHGHTDQMFVV